MDLNDLYYLLEEKEIINGLPEGPQEVEEYFGEVLCAIENIIDCIVDRINFTNLPKN